MPSNLPFCSYGDCKRESRITVSESPDPTTAKFTYYCSDFHAGVALIQKWAAASKSGTTIKRFYKTASGLLDKLAKAVEKEWAKTAPEKPSANG